MRARCLQSCCETLAFAELTPLDEKVCVFYLLVEGEVVEHKDLQHKLLPPDDVGRHVDGQEEVLEH